MTATMTAWLLLAAVLAWFCWVTVARAERPIETVLALALTTAGAFFLVQIPLGYPDAELPPKGEYVVNGARIDVDVAIYAMLSQDGEPHLYVFPYSNQTSQQLQEVLDEDDGDVLVGISSEGKPVFYRAPVAEDAPKVVDTPTMGVQ